MSDALRILIVTEALVAGGAETFALRLTGKLRQLGHDCDLLCLNSDLIDDRLLVRSGVEPIVVPLPAIRWLKRLDRLARSLGVHTQLQRRLTVRLTAPILGRYDIVHSNLLGADLLLAACKQRRPGLRIVSTLHGDYSLREHGRASKSEGRSHEGEWPAEKALLKRTINRWATISAEQQRSMIGMGVEPGRLVRIPNGYEPSPAALAARRGRGGEPFTIVMAARGNIPEKGWEPLIAAFCRLTGDVRLILIGSGAHLSMLERQHGGDRRIVFAGFQADPAVTIAVADLFALPSTYPAESLPTVIIEALSVGVPVVATNVGEVGAMLTGPGGAVAGCVLPLRHGEVDVEELRAAIQGFVDDRAALARAAEATAGAFRPYDLTSCAEAYVDLYSDVLSSSGTRARTSASH